MLASLSGILSLGFGDAAASLVGKRFGCYHWPGTKKTAEGTMAFIFAVFASSSLILYGAALVGVDHASLYVASAGREEWLKYGLVITLTGKDDKYVWGCMHGYSFSQSIALLEAFSTQNDNIIIPLYMYALVILL